MKIILITSNLGLGGTERVVADLCNTWTQRGDQVTLILTYSGAGSQFYPISPQAELIFLADIVGIRNVSPASYLKRLFTLRRLISARTPDVIVSFLPNANVATILSSLFLKTPLVICERSDPAGYSSWHVLSVLRNCVYRYADMLTVQTQNLVDKSKMRYPGLRAVQAIPNALPAQIASLQKSAGSQRKILLSLGRLAPEKQIDKLLEVFSRIAPRMRDWDLHIYGDGPSRTAIEQQIQRLGLQDRALLKGTTTTPWDIMARADAFVMVSLFEGFPNALLEAMGIGLPCIVFDCPSGPREITRDGRDGLLVPLNDFDALAVALEKLLGNEKLRLSLGRQARESVSARFSHAQVMEKWDQLFKHVGAR